MQSRRDLPHHINGEFGVQRTAAGEKLFQILARYVEEDRSVLEIVSDGFDADLVSRVAGLVDRNEYKRRQAAPGVRITRKAFGKDRRLPITNRYREA